MSTLGISEWDIKFCFTVQGGQPNPGINIGAIAKAGEKCVDKIEYIEEVVQDEEIKCHHTYEKKCQTSFTTDFESVQEEECSENFQKDCFIEYKKVKNLANEIHILFNKVIYLFETKKKSSKI